MSTQTVTTILSILTVVGDVLIVLFIIDLLISRFRGEKKLTLVPKLWLLMRNKALEAGFIFAFFAMAGSLYYSEVAGFTPCRLCWYQRIFMYPMVVIFGVALYMKEQIIYRYTIALSIVGAVIAGYHYFIQVFVDLAPEGCSAVGYAASCSERFVLNFGYISIPMMALTAFLLIIIAGLLQGKLVEIKEA